MKATIKLIDQLRSSLPPEAHPKLDELQAMTDDEDDEDFTTADKPVSVTATN
jgi:hypothetical protein